METYNLIKVNLHRHLTSTRMQPEKLCTQTNSADQTSKEYTESMYTFKHWLT